MVGIITLNKWVGVFIDMKFIISEEEKKHIRALYGGLLNEQQNIEVKIEGQQPYPKTDWDTVHGYFGSKKLSDDLEERVSNQLAKGNYRVDNIVISTTKEGSSIKTKGSVFLRPTGPDEVPHKHFTTRGSIGITGSTAAEKSDPDYYVNRHDRDVTGLDDRLKLRYNSDNVEVFGPYEIFIKGTPYAYKQSFFAVEGQPSNNLSNKTNVSKTKTLQGTDFGDLRNKMKSELIGDFSINPNSFVLDTNTFKLQYSEGNTPVKSISLIYDDSGQLENRLPQILEKNPTMKVATKGRKGNVEWAILYFQ